jgi:NAD(P)-dependent dehydrogenase (short-subunit alcohol dehydrogenase family)
MMRSMEPRTILTLGARNLGGAILDHFLAQGWKGAAVARSEDTLAAVRDRGALAIAADAADPADLERAIAATRAEHGSIDLIVNAVTASRPPQGGPWGGGPIAEGTMEAMRGWTVAVAEQAFAFLSTGARALLADGGGTLVQVTGGSSRRAMPGRGPWAAGAFATRALTQAAAQELRGQGVHVALLIVDATIESPKTAERTADAPRDSLGDMTRIAEAVRFLAEQEPRAYTHELMVTPAGETWVP